MSIAGRPARGATKVFGGERGEKQSLARAVEHQHFGRRIDRAIEREAAIEPFADGVGELIEALVRRIAAEFLDMRGDDLADESRDRMLRLADRETDRGLARRNVVEQLAHAHERRARAGGANGRRVSGIGGRLAGHPVHHEQRDRPPHHRTGYHRSGEVKTRLTNRDPMSARIAMHRQRCGSRAKRASRGDGCTARAASFERPPHGRFRMTSTIWHGAKRMRSPRSGGESSHRRPSFAKAWRESPRNRWGMGAAQSPIFGASARHAGAFALAVLTGVKSAVDLGAEAAGRGLPASAAAMPAAITAFHAQ